MSASERVDARIHIYDFAHALATHADVFVLAPDTGGEKEVDKQVPVTWFPLGKNNVYNVYNNYKVITRARREAFEFAERNRINFCLAAWAIPSGYFAYYVKKTAGIPYAIWALGSDIHTYARYPILRKLMAIWLTHADLRFANSYCLCDEVMRLSGKDCTFMPVISDFPSQSRKKRPNPRKLFQFLYVGRLEKIKGIDLLIRACKLLTQRDELFHLDIVGDGSMRNQLEKEVRVGELGKNVEFYGNQGKEGVIKHMLKAECLVIPSRKESFPQVLLEAAKLGLPVIAADAGDCRRILFTYRCGVLVENNTPANLADAMFHCIKDRRSLQMQYSKGLQAFITEYTRVRPEVFLMQKFKTTTLQ